LYAKPDELPVPMRTLEDSFVRSMVERFPSMRDVLDEHLEEFGELLPYVFFGDVTRHVVLLLQTRSTSGARQERELRSILDHLEDAYAGGSPQIQDLIHVSFLENLPRPGESGSELRRMVGPKLSAGLRLID
jgi:hypothetical protein